MVLSTADFSVIICSYSDQRLPDLTETIQSIQAQTLPALDIVVVIDHNEALLRKARGLFPDACVVENRGMQGASGARNSGVAAAKGRIFAFIDDDAVACPDWLERLAAVYTHDLILGAGGTIDPLWCADRPAWFPEEFYWVIGATYKGLPRTTAPLRNLWTGNMSIRRDAFEGIQGFRDGFGKQGSRSSPEDTDFCIRLRKRNPYGLLLYTPEARVLHKVPPERTTPAFFMRRCWNEGQAKAHLSSLVGLQQGTSSERRHLLHVLPKGILQGFADGLLRHDRGGFLRAAAILAGSFATLLGYLSGTLECRLRIARPARLAHKMAEK